MNKEKVIHEVLSYTKIVILSLAFGVILNHTLLVNATVPTGSMEDTIPKGSRLFLNRLAYVASKPQRGDIVAFHCPDGADTPYLKRILALPGETIQGSNGKILINGVELEEDYIKEACYVDFGPYKVPEDSYFMMGDNRNNSDDSRYWDKKFVKKKDIIAKGFLEYYPRVKWLD